MLTNIGVPGLILIIILALIIFGPKKLPEMGRAMGQTLKEFKRSTKGLIEENESVVEKETVLMNENKKEIEQPEKISK